MPKINVYLPQWLAESVRSAELSVSEICQRALTEALGERSMPGPTQSLEERQKDLERAAAAVRYALAPTKTVPASVRPIGAATALAALRAEDPSLVQWETRAQEVVTWAAALEVAAELNAPAAVCELLQKRLTKAEAALAKVKVSSRFGSKSEVLDVVAELQERAHPRDPR